MQQEWIGALDPVAIENAQAGCWFSRGEHEDAPDGDAANVTILKAAPTGPFVVVAAAKCASIFERFLETQKRLPRSGALILVSCPRDPVSALEAKRFKDLVDEADEILIAAPGGELSWSRLKNPRFRAISDTNLIREMQSTMRSLGL